ncbi:MAG TPA: SRPBCC domain-containing protein, partial [Steroidobacteraceae bacterium]|nr:SRPBCC domain-containing protein [Steroidobacteraceae bacterium]
QAADAAGDDSAAGLSHDAEAIHQEVTFAASPRVVYDVLTGTARFDAVTRLSDAVTLLSAPGAQATSIASQPGGAFVLFGGYITGRHVEMVPGERLVQAWRTGSWSAGHYSIVTFTLAAASAGCHLKFDHRGFPPGQGASLAYGWRVHYWEPLALLLRKP